MKKIFYSSFLLSIFFVACKKDKCECIYSGYINKVETYDREGKDCDEFNQIITGEIGNDSINIDTKVTCEEK